jgi:hypothetical protein
MKDIKFIDYAISDEDQRRLDEVLKLVKEKPKAIKYRREAKFLKQFTLALMKQYKYNKPNVVNQPKVKYIKQVLKKIPIPPIPTEIKLEEFVPEVPDFVKIEEHHEIMPEAPHKKDIPEAPKAKVHIELPEPPKFNSDSLPKFPDNSEKKEEIEIPMPN